MVMCPLSPFARSMFLNPVFRDIQPVHVFAPCQRMGGSRNVDILEVAGHQVEEHCLKSAFWVQQMYDLITIQIRQSAGGMFVSS